jgi:hypothetical protein
LSSNTKGRPSACPSESKGLYDRPGKKAGSQREAEGASRYTVRHVRRSASLPPRLREVQEQELPL